MTRKTVVLLDDDARLRETHSQLMQSLGYEVLSFGATEAFLRCNWTHAACLVVDAGMPDLDPLGLLAEIRRCIYEVPIVFLCKEVNVRLTVAAIKAGAEDFLAKPVATDELVASVARASQRSEVMRNIAVANAARQARYQRLTRREREVLDALLRGLRNKQIAAELGTTERTIKAHRSRIMQKLEVRSVAELVMMTGNLHNAPTFGPRVAASHPAAGAQQQ